MRLVTRVILIALLTAACGGDTADPVAEQSAEPSAEPTQTEEAIPSDCEEVTEVSMVGIEFEPRCAAVSGTEVTVTNDSEALHSFTIRATDIDVDVQPGATETVDVSGAVTPGELTEFYCKYHAPMVGDLVVQ